MGVSFNLADATMLVVFILSIFIAVRRGFFRSLFDLIGFSVAVVLAFLTYRPITLGMSSYSNFNPAEIAVLVELIIVGCTCFLFTRLRLFYTTLLLMTFSRLPGYYKFDRHLGFLPGLGIGYLLTSLAFMIVIPALPWPQVQALAAASWAGNIVDHQRFLSRITDQPAVYLGQAGQFVENNLKIPEQKISYVPIQTERINETRSQSGLSLLDVPASQPNQQTPKYQTPTNPTQPARTNPSVAELEQKVFDLTNQERQKQGVPALMQDSAIRAVARAHSNDMVARKFFNHNNPEGLTPFERLKIGGISFSSAAENISLDQSAEAAVQAWMESPGHRANILNPQLHKLGVGVAIGSDGMYFTQDFTD